MHCDSIRKKSWRRIVAVSPSTGSRRFSGSGVLTSPCRIWCGPCGGLSTKKSRLRARHPRLRAVQRVILLQQGNAIRNRRPLKKQSQRLRSRTRFLNNPAPESRRRNWRKKGGGRDERVRRCHRLVRGEGRSSGRGRVVKNLFEKVVCDCLPFRFGPVHCLYGHICIDTPRGYPPGPSYCLFSPLTLAQKRDDGVTRILRA